ncbi:carbohydrate-binding protein [Bosea sp. TND4EK4]|uniref:carbohydrate-binding protein n=1 Tax=Bosea sp. TND4EK4 TaxID=1907408 RepID=UPI000953C245|nr:carbohydrate-binding protein [Bosea sp. TND4EK4]SIQ76022.1 hypothetical protein SAMN05880592_105160 [Bosea sp. TND4EK4]
MAQPTPYDRQANFSNEETLNPTGKTPGASLDAEFGAVKLSLDQTQANLALIQRDDGRLANGSVGQDQLADSLSVGFTLRGGWTAPENYVAGDGVTYDSVFYRALVSHLSVIGETPNVEPTLWLSVADFTDLAPAFIPDRSVTDAKLRNSVGVSVIGRSANSVGTPTDIAAGANNRVLQRKADALVFDRLATDALEDEAVTTAKIADGALSADATGWAKMTDGFVTTAKIADGALSGDATGWAKMSDGFVTTAKVADGFLSADADGRAKLADKLVTFAKLVDVPTGIVLGRKTAGAGVVEELSASDIRTLIATATGQDLLVAADAAAGRAALSAPASPSSASGVGQLVPVGTAASNGYNFPSGGTWWGFVSGFNASTGAYASGIAATVGAGGSALVAPAANVTWVGFAWRIA